MNPAHAHATFGVVCFFFQAEDGIRDSSVTGVQTCALPISNAARRAGLSHVIEVDAQSKRAQENLLLQADRKSVVEGKSVDLGGRRIIKKKKTKATPRLQ